MYVASDRSNSREVYLHSSRLKNWMRSTMAEDSLSALALMHVHRDIDISVDDVIDSFAKSHQIKLNFVI